MADLSPFSMSGPSWALRVARPEDNNEVCELFRAIHLGGDLDVTQERDPDFFALGRMHTVHAGTAETLVARHETTGRMLGCGTAITRPAWLEGREITAGYLGDLRVVPDFRGGRHLALAYGEYFAQVRDRLGAQVFTTVIFDTNAQARAALTKASEKRAGMPVYRLMAPFHMTSLQITTRRPKPSTRVSRARASDHDEIVNFLCRMGKRRVLGEVFDHGLLDARLEKWPGFSIEDFILVRDGRGALVGCCAPWDTSSFKRTRVLGYHGQMRSVKIGFDLGARVLGFTPLPAPGACFQFRFLTHLEVEDDDPGVLHDLLLAAYERHYDEREAGWHFVSAMIPRGSRLAEAFRGFLGVQRTPMSLYSVHIPGSELESMDLRTFSPGFEMALS